MFTEELVSQFAKALSKHDVSQAEAARQIGVGATHLNRILKGARKPSRELLEKMVTFSKSLKPTG